MGRRVRVRLNKDLIGEKDGDGPSHLVDRYEVASSGRGIDIYIQDLGVESTCAR